MKLRSLVSLLLVLGAAVAAIGTGASANPSASQQTSTSISFTVTTTTSYPMTTGGALQVTFNSVQLTYAPPPTYGFGVTAKTFPGFWITRLHWQFGDGDFKDIPYCCQSQVSEVQYHSYTQEGSYSVLVVAYDNAGSFGNAIVTVNWTTPIPEYPNYSLVLVGSLLILALAAASIRKNNSWPLKISM